MPVIGSDGETLGEVEGFIIVPIGHVRTNDGDTELRVEVAKSQVENSPGFHKKEFQKLAAEDATRLDELVAAATGSGRDYSGDSFRMPQGWN